MVLLLIFGAGSVALRAQHVLIPNAVVVSPRTPLEKTLQSQIVCMCGTCGRQRIAECTCSTAEAMRQELAKLTAQGLTHDQIIEFYVKKYGSQEVLASPIDQGFNRLAWLLPYGVGLVGMVGIAGMAVRWSRRRHTVTPATAPAIRDEALESRLDDELRDLD